MSGVGHSRVHSASQPSNANHAHTHVTLPLQAPFFCSIPHPPTSARTQHRTHEPAVLSRTYARRLWCILEWSTGACWSAVGAARTTTSAHW
jgi:hypothetical protein